MKSDEIEKWVLNIGKAKLPYLFEMFLKISFIKIIAKYKCKRKI